jgi:hypothetical protein
MNCARLERRFPLVGAMNCAPTDHLEGGREAHSGLTHPINVVANVEDPHFVVIDSSSCSSDDRYRVHH